MNKEELKTLVKVELARRPGGFYYYCQCLYPDFYKSSRPFLRELCDSLEQFIYDPKKKYLCLSIGPRHGKTLTLGLLCSYMLGQDKNTKIMTGSYNEDFASILCKTIRNRIQEKKYDKEKLIHNDIFLSTIEKGSGRATQFKLDGAEGTISVLATSPNASATGYPANIILLDDLLKDAASAVNPKKKEALYRDFFTGTLLSRLQGDTRKVIICNTRWATDDITGRLLEDKKDDMESVVNINLKCLKEDGTMLCDEILNREQYEELKKMMPEEIFQANYNGVCLSLKHILYNIGFETYNKNDFKEEDWDETIAYCDPADSGEDSLCFLIASTTKKYPNRLFIRDIYFTKESMEVTSPIIAQKLTDYKVTHFKAEGNGAGRFWAINIGNLLDELGNKFTQIETFHQKETKKIKIFEQSYNVQKYIIMPEHWDAFYPTFFKEVLEMKTIGRTNEHDDAADSLSELIIMAVFGKYIELI